MRNLQIVIRLCDKKTKDVVINIYKIHEKEEGGDIVVRSIKDRFQKHRELISLEDAKNQIEDREYHSLSNALAYIQDQLYEYSKAFDVVCTMIGSANLMSNHKMRQGHKGTKDMIHIVSTIKEYFDSGLFMDAVKTVSSCFK